MDSLYSRVQELHDLQVDAFRIQEHNTLDRLLYKNRNQHRRGPYFQRVEHVRRVVRKLRNHPACNFVRAVAAPSSDESKKKSPGRHRKRKKPAVTAELATYFEQLATMTEELVDTIIPKAALRVTLELVCREHFLPFAVSVLAILSRIFTIERTLLPKIQGIVVEMRILCPVPKKVRVRESARPTMDAEDVGEVIKVEDCNDLESMKPVELQQPMLLPEGSKAGRKMVNRFCAPVRLGSTVDKASWNADENVESQTEEAPSTSKNSSKDASRMAGSLYDLMAEEDSDLASLAKAHVDASIRIEAAPSPSHAASAKTAQRENMDEKIVPNTSKAQSECEDSEDLDDIFAGMSD